MKLASLRDGTRDGTLVLVSPDGRRILPRPAGISTMQRALDRWDEVVPLLQAAWERLAADEEAGQPLQASALHSPLPRAYQWCEGSSYLTHMERMRAARGMSLPPEHTAEPIVYQAGADALLGPCDPLVLPDAGWGLDLEATPAVITGDVPRGTTADDAPGHIVLVTLANDVTYRNLMAREYAKSVGPYQAKPARAFAPFAVAPAALGPAWNGRLLCATLRSWVNGELLGAVESGEDNRFDFAVLIAYLARTRALAAGTIVGAGTVSNRDASRGFGCLGEKRAMETVAGGSPATPWLQHGDRVRIEAFDEYGESLFGAIDQLVVA